jgi:hypothetical protein
LQASVERLVTFGTRHTPSSATDHVRGVGPATDWVFDQLQAIAETWSGRMTVARQSFTQPQSSRIPTPTPITNVITAQHATTAPDRVTLSPGTSTRA